MGGAAPELEAVVEATVRALIARADRPVQAEAIVREAVALLRPLLAALSRPAPAAAGHARVVVERDVLAAVPAGRLEVPLGAVITPLAREAAAERGVELVARAG